MNLIPKICELIGVEIDEEFKISQGGEVLDNGALYKFNGTWFFKHNNIDDNWDVCADSTLLLLLNGHIEIVKLPFEPEKGEKYFRVIVFRSKFEITEDVWGDAIRDYEAKYCGNCFRTESEAEREKYNVYERLTGKKWEHEQ